jgi:LysM repeat protein
VFSKQLSTTIRRVLVLVLVLGFAGSAAAEREHTVKPGQTLAGLAKKYGVTVWSLAAANRLEPQAALRAGQVLAVPDKGVVYVNSGQTLWSVARRHGCSVEALARTNGLKTNTSLRPGMRLVLPGHEVSSGGGGGGGSGKSWGTPKVAGRVSLVRAGTGKRLSLTLIDGRGRVRPEAQRQMARFLRPRNVNKSHDVDRRLLGLLARVSDHFGGRTIHVVSGYRKAGGYTKHESRHVKGAAIDLRVEGVPNRVLRDRLRMFDDVGVGFYPNSSFVHFDVRSSNAYWVDVSGPGQRPNYLPREVRDSFDADKSREADLADVGNLAEQAIEEMVHGEPEGIDVNDE